MVGAFAFGASGVGAAGAGVGRGAEGTLGTAVLPGTVRFADLTTKKLPVAARVCLNTPRKYVPCSRRHQAEDIAEMVLNTAIEKGQITGKKAVRRKVRRVKRAVRKVARRVRVAKAMASMMGEMEPSGM